MDEHVLAAGPLDESIALCGVKPFHDTLFSHYFNSPISVPGLAGAVPFKTLSLSHGSLSVCNQVLPSCGPAPVRCSLDLTAPLMSSRLRAVGILRLLACGVLCLGLATTGCIQKEFQD